MASMRGREGRPYRRSRAIYRAKCASADAPCALCRGELGPIDYSSGADKTPLGFQVDHIVPWSRLLPGDPMRWSSDNWQPAHAVCNQRKNKNFGSRHKQAPSIRRPDGW